MIRALFLLLIAASFARADEGVYTIYRTNTPLEIDGQLDELAWGAVPAVSKFVFPWWEEGEKEQTVAKILWDEQYLYVSFLCQDAHIWGKHVERDGPVFEDDCVEVFIAPNPKWPEAYFNVEMNVLGIFLDGFHPADTGIVVEGNWNTQGVRIATSIAGTLNDDEDEDRYWILEAALPLSNFAQVAAHTPPLSGDMWHLNLNRLGGQTNRQHSQWQASQTEIPNFHVPADFGRVIFSPKVSPFWDH